jgi:uncharacterized membrane protein
MTDLHSLKLWAIIIGLGLIVLGGAIFAAASDSFRPDAAYFKFRAGEGKAQIGGVLMIAGVLALYLAITDVRLLNHFLYGP